ncbi:MAG: PfkB family carbohydrate kinase [Promethearchaeota archaeon]
MANAGHDSEELDLIFIGHVAKDIIEANGTKSMAAGGGVYYGGHAAVVLGKKIAVVTRCKKEDSILLDSLRDSGAKVFVTFSKQTSGIHNIYPKNTMETRTCIPLGFAGKFLKEEIPRNIKAKYVMITPIIAGEVDLDLIKYIHDKNIGNLCLDVQGFVRVRENNKLVFQDWDDKEEGLSFITILKMDHAEAKNLTGLSNIKSAAEKASAWGPKEIIITHENGASIFHENELFTFPWMNKLNAGRTGRGDTLFASYVATRITSSPKYAMKRATSVASLKMEKPGPISIPLKEIIIHEKKFFKDRINYN